MGHREAALGGFSREAKEQVGEKGSESCSIHRKAVEQSREAAAWGFPELSRRTHRVVRNVGDETELTEA